jgi:hypothetical protein
VLLTLPQAPRVGPFPAMKMTSREQFALTVIFRLPRTNMVRLSDRQFVASWTQPDRIMSSAPGVFAALGTRRSANETHTKDLPIELQRLSSMKEEAKKKQSRNWVGGGTTRCRPQSQYLGPLPGPESL